MNKSIGIGMLAAALLALPVGPILAQAPGGAPPVFGTVDSVDSSAKTITVSTPQGDTGTIKISSTTAINTEKTVTVADLKVGDKIQVSGAPTGITAASIVDGDLAAAMPSFGGFRRPGGPGGPGGFRGGPGGPGGGDFAIASGTITGTSPLTIALEGGATLTVALAPTATVSMVAAESISDIKAGDRVMASGTLNDDGSLNAAKVAVNINMGFGGRGGRPGGG